MAIMAISIFPDEVPSALPDVGMMTEGDVEMVVDEGSVGTSWTGTGKWVLWKGQVCKTPVMEVSISKVTTPVSVWIAGYNGH